MMCLVAIAASQGSGDRKAKPHRYALPNAQSHGNLVKQNSSSASSLLYFTLVFCIHCCWCSSVRKLVFQPSRPCPSCPVAAPESLPAKHSKALTVSFPKTLHRFLFFFPLINIGYEGGNGGTKGMGGRSMGMGHEGGSKGMGEGGSKGMGEGGSGYYGMGEGGEGGSKGMGEGGEKGNAGAMMAPSAGASTTATALTVSAGLVMVAGVAGIAVRRRRKNSGYTSVSTRRSDATQLCNFMHMHCPPLRYPYDLRLLYVLWNANSILTSDVTTCLWGSYRSRLRLTRTWSTGLSRRTCSRSSNQAAKRTPPRTHLKGLHGFSPGTF